MTGPFAGLVGPLQRDPATGALLLSVDTSGLTTAATDGQVPVARAGRLGFVDPLWVNVKDPRFGAKGDGSTDDTAAIQAAIDSVLSRLGGGLTSGGVVYLPQSAEYMVSAPILLPDSIKLRGAGPAATVIKAKPTHTGPCMIRNKFTNGTQEQCYVEDLLVHGNNIGGATVGDGILLDSLFVDTSVRRVKSWYCSGSGLHLKTTTANVNFGLAVLDTIQCAYNSQDQMLLENGPGPALDLSNIDVEHFTAGFHGLHVSGGVNGAQRLNIRNLYSENGIANAASVWLENVSGVLIDGLWMGGTPTAGQAALRITGANQWSTSTQSGSRGIEARNIVAVGGSGTVLVDDQTRSRSVTSAQAPSICMHYNTEVGTALTAPAIPASTVTQVNNFWVDAMVYITAAAGGTTAVQTDGGTTLFTIPASGIASVRVPSGTGIKLVYASAPTWKWVGA